MSMLTTQAPHPMPRWCMACHMPSATSAPHAHTIHLSFVKHPFTIHAPIPPCSLRLRCLLHCNLLPDGPRPAVSTVPEGDIPIIRRQRHNMVSHACDKAHAWGAGALHHWMHMYACPTVTTHGLWMHACTIKARKTVTPTGGDGHGPVCWTSPCKPRAATGSLYSRVARKLSSRIHTPAYTSTRSEHSHLHPK